MTKSYIYIISILLLASCGKEEMGIKSENNECDIISRFNQEVDFVDIYGDSFLFRNLKTNEQKEFKHSISESSRVSFNDTILCTHLTYDELTILKYISDDSDFIAYNIPQYFDGRNDFTSGISNQLFQLDGKVIESSRYLTGNARISFINDLDYIITYINDQGLLVGYDDLDGNQWVINDLNSDMFYCEVEDNLGSYKKHEEFELYNRLGSRPLFYSDGNSATVTFQNVEQNIFPSYKAEISNDCPEQKLSINQYVDMNLSFSFGNIYNLNLGIFSQNEAVQSDKKFSIIRIFMWDVRDGKELYNIHFVIDPYEIFEEDFFTPTPFVFHESLDINNNGFTDVYEFTNSGKSLFFNYDYGILAFTDHLEIMNYLDIE